jgi:hypothetical protein
VSALSSGLHKDVLTASQIRERHEGAYGSRSVSQSTADLASLAECSADPPGKDWEWIQILPSMRAEFVDYNDGTYELVTVKCPTHCPRLFNTKWDGEDAYATGDLLIPHPTKEGFWKVYGRVDDQIMLSSGEKVEWARFSRQGAGLIDPN